MRPIHALPVVLVVAALAGCGGGDDDNGDGGAGTTSGAPAQTQQTQTETRTAPDAGGPDGEEVFASAGCGNCHMLAAANSNGNVGPNLDDAQPDVATVRTKVENGGGGMPAFSGDLSPEEIDAVARYVSENAGR